MKKIISTFLLVCILALSFVSCGDNNKGSTNVVPEKTDVEIVEELIDSINSAETCYTAAQKYYFLDSAEKRQVSNYSKLEAEVKKYPNDEDVGFYYYHFIIEKKTEKTFREYNDLLKKDLPNISSYTVNEQTTEVLKSDIGWYLKITIDYSAQNKMGGYTRYPNNYRFYKWNGSDWEVTSAGTINEEVEGNNYHLYTKCDFTY